MDGGSGSASLLSMMFSSEEKERFARKFKPVEIEPLPKPQAVEAEEEKKDKKKKKEKWKKRTLESAEAEHILATRGSAAEDKGDEAGDSSTVSRRGSWAAAEPSASEEDQDALSPAAAIENTLFIGNIPLSESIKSIKRLCAEFGEVVSVRLRSVPIAGTAVDEAGNQNLVKKICANRRQFSTVKGSFNAYVVFKDKESVSRAVLANGRVLGDRHLRFDFGVPTMFDPKKTVFVGSLPLYTDEEELRNHFASVSQEP